jgi:hypothetical protein
MLARRRDTVRNSSILWKRRHDPGLAAAVPFIHAFRPNSIASFGASARHRQAGRIATELGLWRAACFGVLHGNKLHWTARPLDDT